MVDVVPAPPSPVSHSIDSIYIFGKSPAAAEHIRDAIQLRGFEEIKCFDLACLLSDGQPAPWPQHHPPELMILDAEGQQAAVMSCLDKLPASIPVIVLAESFEEEIFIHCFDHGARDFLVKPYNMPYLVSRILLILESQRMKHQLRQHREILKDLSVISVETDIFSKEYFQSILEQQIERLRASHHIRPDELTLLLITFGAADESSLEIPPGRGLGGDITGEVEKTGSWPSLREACSNPLFRQSLLRQCATIITRCCRSSDLVGERDTLQFGILLPYTGLQGGTVVSQRISRQLHGREFCWRAQSVRLGITIGMADYSGCSTSEDLVRKALNASYF